MLLLGAGPVGLELAGEITERWPSTEVVVVDPAEDVLGGRYLPELRGALREQLAARGVRLELGSALTAMPPVAPGVREAFSVTTEAGTRIDADLWFRMAHRGAVIDFSEQVLTERRVHGGNLSGDATKALERTVAVYEHAIATHPTAAARREPRTWTTKADTARKRNGLPA